MALADHDHQKQAFWPGRLSALVPLLLFIWFALQVPRLGASAIQVIQVNWVPSLGIDVSFVLDGLSVLYALIISGIGTLVMLYADAYMAGHSHITRFYLYLHAFLFSMLGLVLSDNLLLVFVFWELTTLTSFLLIGFEAESEQARSSARQALLVTGGGGLLLLVGILLTGQAGATYSLTQLTHSDLNLRSHPLYLPILLCILAGAFTKSAQFPFHFWLPNAMTAPTPISAFLHSATMVKAGVYLLTRFHPILGGTFVWMTTLVCIGAVTALWGSMLALGQKDLKRVLAYTTVMALGIITMFLGGRTTPSLTAAVTFLLVHALYKSSLFLVVGIIDHQTGTRLLDKLGGIGSRMPFTAAAAAMATLSMAGFPLFLGFIGKEIMYKGALTETVFPELATTAALLANGMMSAVATIIALRPFWGKRLGTHPVSESAWQMWFGPLLLGGIGLFFGLIPEWVGRRLIEPAVLAFHPTTEIIKLKLFHGINEPLLLSIITLSMGACLYLGRRKLRNGIGQLTARLPVTMEGIYTLLMNALIRIADLQTRILQNGSLFRYLMVIIGSIVAAVGWALALSGETDIKGSFSGLNTWQCLLVVLMLVAVGVAVRSSSRLLIICALGVIGAGIAMIFVSFGAPDVALTQLLVETLTLIIAAIVLLRLPPIPALQRLREGQPSLRLLAALGSGLMVAVLLLAVSQYDVDRSVTDFYEKASYLQAHGRNIVNVILVDFRSLDTMGEIIVVATSALAALALIQKGKTKS